MKRVNDILSVNDYVNILENKPFGIFKYIDYKYQDNLISNYLAGISNYYYMIRSGNKLVNRAYYNSILNFVNNRKWFTTIKGMKIDENLNIISGTQNDYITPPIPYQIIKNIKFPSNASVYTCNDKGEIAYILDWGKKEYSFDNMSRGTVRFYISYNTNPINYIEIETQDITEYFNRITLDSLMYKYGNSWSKIIEVLLNSQYDALDELGENITKHIDEEKNFEHGLAITKTNTENTTKTFTDNLEIKDDYFIEYGKKTEGSSEAKTKTDETTTEGSSNTDSYYAFNSVKPVPTNVNSYDSTSNVKGSEKNNETLTITGEELSGRDSSLNTEVHSGKQTNAITGSITTKDTHDGTDVNTDTYDESKNRSGRMHSPAELIEKELNLRNKNILFDIICRDIDSVLCLSIY